MKERKVDPLIQIHGLTSLNLVVPRQSRPIPTHRFTCLSTTIRDSHLQNNLGSITSRSSVQDPPLFSHYTNLCDASRLGDRIHMSA
ncbi:hypothetical protein JAAARDRAFT_482495 [Jaapia argillacea MUCL 33604]|uniref:Uncharacterized protein n=1 Tax=Jaapia argillacea MUCL 33604 TaxID=933084 RepID=A0A067PPZ8_9AGAM|nr:hypothetical protein JAAARDRAFT_482495 [Jaapia argillacea MUCL 33604]